MANHSAVDGKNFGLETTFVLFFLSLDFGQHILAGSFDLAFLGITVVLLAVLPYFLPSRGELGLGAWVTGRSAIVVLGVVAGVAYKQIIGVVVPEFMGYLPLALATISGFAACCLMYANLLNFSYAD